MASILRFWIADNMSAQKDEDLEAVLRSLKLAQAQLRSLKRDYKEDSGKESEIEDVDLAIDLLLRKLKGLLAKDSTNPDLP